VNNEQNEIIRNMIDKGKRALVTADMNFENEDYDFASSKAYYAVFYFTQAALYTKDLVLSKHSANISEFNLFEKLDVHFMRVCKIISHQKFFIKVR